MRIFTRKLVLAAFFVAVGTFLFSCSKNEPAGILPPPAPAGTEVLLLTACSNESLHRMVTDQFGVTENVDLFESLTEDEETRVKAADLIFLLVSGDRMDVKNDQDILRLKWDSTLRPVADKIVIIYDATVGSGAVAAKAVGVDAGPGYYIKAMGMGGYCKMLAPDELTPEALAGSVRLVQANAALGNSNEERVNTFRFVKTARIAYCQSPGLGIEAPSAPVLYSGDAVTRLSAEERERSVLGNFLVEYTVYTAQDAKEKYVQIDLKGAGFTTNMMFYDFKGHLSPYISDRTAVGGRNMPIAYFTSISVSGGAGGVLPVVKKVLPVSDNRNTSVSESSEFNIGFTAAKDPSLSFGFSWSNSISYDQSEWETKVSYTRDMETNTVAHSWETLPVYTYNHQTGSFLSDGCWDFIAHGRSGDPIGEAVAQWGKVRRIDPSVYPGNGKISALYVPLKFAVTYNDFQPRQSMLVLTEGKELRTVVEAGVVEQSFVFAEYDQHSVRSLYWVHGDDRSAKAVCSQDIRFDDENIFQ